MENAISILKKCLPEIDEKYFNRNERDFSYEIYN